MDVGAVFISAFVLGLSGAVMPGPLLTVTLERVLKTNWKASIWTTTGHAILELTLVIGLAFGLGTLLMLPQVTGIIGLLGGLLLLWMAKGMIIGAYQDKLGFQTNTSVDTTGDTSPYLSLRAGMLATVSNPYWFLWWATIGTTSFILWTGQQTANLAAFYIGHVLADYGWLILVSLALQAGKKIMRPITYRILVGVLGLFLVVLAIYFIHSGINFLLGSLTIA